FPIATASPSPSSAALATSETVTGAVLRRSLYFTFVAWIPGAFWTGATTGTSMTKLGEFLGANDLIFSIIFTAGPMLAVLWQLPGYLAVERLGRRKKLFVWACTGCRGCYVLMGLLPWVLPAHALGTASVLAFLVFVAMSLHNFSAQAWV